MTEEKKAPEGKTCGDCKHFMIGPGNPMQGTCTRKRLDLGEKAPTDIGITGKLVKRNRPACEYFEELGDYLSDESARQEVLRRTV
jgi:hypothetical protein